MGVIAGDARSLDYGFYGHSRTLGVMLGLPIL